MKSILIFSHAMELGGAERALLGLLENIDTTKYEVDLFLMRHSGEMMGFIPNNIHLLPEIPQYTCLAVPIIDVIKKGHLRIAWGRYRGKKAARKRVTELNLGDNDVALEYSHKYTVKFMPEISEKVYDLAISFLTPHYFVAEKVIAKKKIAWIHTDYKFIACDVESQIHMWDQYDSIISISEDVSDSFISRFPLLSEKLVIIENIMPMKLLSYMANEFNANDEIPEDGNVKLLSIGRFSFQKNFDNIPAILYEMHKKNPNIKWYIIGYGSSDDISQITQEIKKYALEESVIILGKKTNPYPYIKACDIYVQPSRYEGKSVAVREAQILNKPVIITKYPTSSSQLIDGYDGVIVPMDNEGCANGIVRVILDLKLQKLLIENTQKKDYSNQSEIEKIYRIIDEC